MVKDDSLTMELVDEDEFEEQSLSDEEENRRKNELQSLSITRSKQSLMGSCTQVTVYTMFMCVVMGVCMLALHIVANRQPNSTTIITVGMAAAWIAIANVFAFAAFVIDKCQAFNSQPRMSEALALTQFAFGGIVGGWLAMAITCYKPPGTKKNKLSGFICRVLFFSAVGIGLIVLLVLRVIIPHISTVLAFTP